MRFRVLNVILVTRNRSVKELCGSKWVVLGCWSISLTYFHFCLPLIPLGASREERDVRLLHVGMPGQEGCCTEIVSL